MAIGYTIGSLTIAYWKIDLQENASIL